MKRRSTVTTGLIFVLIILFVTTAYANPGDNMQNHLGFLYFTTSSSPVLEQDDITEANLRVIRSFGELENIISTDSSVNVLVIDPEDVPSLENSWLQGIYERGVVIAALDTPMSDLASKVGSMPKVDDLRPKHESSEIGVSAIHVTTFGKSGIARRQHSELYPNFSSILPILESFLDFDPYARPSTTLLSKEESSPQFQALLSPSDSWTDYWGVLTGLSYETKDSSTYFGHGYSQYQTITPYWLYVETTTSNNCDYWHQLDHQELFDNYVPWLSIDGLMIGNYYSCNYTVHSGRIESTHKVKAYTYSSITTGNTRKDITIYP